MKKILFVAAMLLTGLSNAMAEEVANLVLNDVTCQAGETVTMTLEMTGSAAGFQTNIYMPEGCTITKVARGAKVKVRDDDDEYIYSFANSDYEDGSKFILCYSVQNIPTSGAGEVAVITVKVGENVTDGVYDVMLKGTECSLGSTTLSTYTEYTAKLTVSTATSITSVGEAASDAKYYNVNGQTIGAPTSGLNIVKTSNGVRKFVK